MFIKNLKNDNSLRNGYEPKYWFRHVKDSFYATKANPCNINTIFHMHLFCVSNFIRFIYWLRLELAMQLTKLHP